MIDTKLSSALMPLALTLSYGHTTFNSLLDLKIRTVELALLASLWSKPLPEAGSSRRVRRGLGRQSWTAKGVWALHVLTALPTSSVIWKKLLGISGSQIPHA